MIRTFLRWLSLLALSLAILTPGMAMAEKGRIYTIKKGDTLWDLSKRFIDDPYYWPNVWSKNPEITNPHLIYPGQKIRILDGKLEILPAYGEGENKPADKMEPAPQSGSNNNELVQITMPDSGIGFILTDEQPLGLLVDSVDNRVLLIKNDLAFVKMNDPSQVTIGDTYGLFERGQMVFHPVTEEPIGTMMYNLGYLQVTEITGATVTAKIIGSYREITRGAELYEYAPPQQEIMLDRSTNNPEALVIAGRDSKTTLAMADIFFINAGSSDGVKTGNLFYLSRPRQLSKEFVEKAGSIELPDEVLGAAVILETKVNTSSAVVIKNIKESAIGDKTEFVTE